MAGYIYCVTNQAMPNLCKCGGTAKDPKIRCKDLSNTSLPLECKLEYFIKVDNWKKAEKIIHKRITDFGVERYDKREWFKCEPSKIKHIFDEYVEEDEGVVDDDVGVKDGDKIINEFFCKVCNYKTEDRTAYYHTKTQKHKICSESISKKEFENIKIENENLIKTIKEKDIIIAQKDIIILEKDNLIKDKDKEINNLLLEKENEKLKNIIKMYKDEISLNSKKLKIGKKILK